MEFYILLTSVDWKNLKNHTNQNFIINKKNNDIDAYLFFSMLVGCCLEYGNTTDWKHTGGS